MKKAIEQNHLGCEFDNFAMEITTFIKYELDIGSVSYMSKDENKTYIRAETEKHSRTSPE